MYTRYPNYRFGSKVKLPENYSGSAFSSGENDISSPSEAEESSELLSAEVPEVDSAQSREESEADVAVMGREEKKIKLPSFKFDVGKLFSGGFGFEELLIIALILLISQGDNDDDTVLLLALLLFIR